MPSLLDGRGIRQRASQRHIQGLQQSAAPHLERHPSLLRVASARSQEGTGALDRRRECLRTGRACSLAMVLQLYPLRLLCLLSLAMAAAATVKVFLGASLSDRPWPQHSFTLGFRTSSCIFNAD
mmetsp:Transcript_135001/g.431298  ORF Transcript_135001/g.431298 Transcript_135001/m.431298 type:complete len:124 (-) Transcript_135001:30-401(-)